MFFNKASTILISFTFNVLYSKGKIIMQRKIFFLTTPFLGILLLLSSCTYYQLTYHPNPAINEKGFPVKNPLFICNVSDSRTITEQMPIDPDANPLILIPLWPYTYSETSPVLRYSFLQANLLNTSKHIIAEDLDKAGIFDYVVTESFNSVKNSKSQKYEAQIPAKAYMLRISIQKAAWSRYLTSYGLSYAGTLLWTFGAPVSYGSVSISIRADLYAPEDYSHPIASSVISESRPCTEFVYDQVNYTPPISEFKLAEMFPSLMEQIRNFLVTSIKNYENNQLK